MNRDLDRFYDGQMDSAEREAFAARLGGDDTLAADLEFRSALDDRLRAAFRMSEPQDGIVAPGHVRASRRHGAWWLAAAAMLLILFGAPFLFGPTRPEIPADQVYARFQSSLVPNCNTPGKDAQKVFQQYVRRHHAVALEFDFTQPALVESPRWIDDPMLGSVMAVVFRGAALATDARVVLIDPQAGFCASKGVRVFEREVRGVRLVELSRGHATPRALPLFR